MHACPHCAATLKIPDSLAGRTASCPSCRQQFTAPAATAQPTLAVQTPAVAPQSSVASRYGRKRNEPSPLVVWLLVGNLLLSSISAGWCLLAEYRIYRIQQAVSEGLENWAEEMQRD